MTNITYVADSFVWSVSTLLMCLIGQAVHWLLSYGRAKQASKALGVELPGLWLYWTGDWPTSLACFLIVFSGYFMLPEIARVWPDAGRALGMIDEHGGVKTLSMFASFMWGMVGNVLADTAGRRMSRLLE